MAESCGLIPPPFFLKTLGKNQKYTKGFIYETHDFPPPSLPSHVKVVWLFGEPMSIALSAYNTFRTPGSIKRHYAHLSSPWAHHHDQIFVRDTLTLAEHFRAWYQPQSFECVSVCYETLYEEKTQQVLRAFLECPLVLRPYRPRNTNWRTHPRKHDILRTYKSLAEQIEQAEKVKIWPKIQ